jgi:hypothetical protein
MRCAGLREGDTAFITRHAVLFASLQNAADQP